MFTVQLKHDSAAWRNAVALTWNDAEQQPVNVDMEVRGKQWIFHCGPRAITLDWGSREASE